MTLLSLQLEAFVAIAESGTVQQAAKIIKLTQTGVTQRLKTLETQLGVGLFLRSSKGMSLTDEGTALYRYCQRVLEIEGETLALLHKDSQSQERSVRVSLAGPSSIMRARVLPKLSLVLKDHPMLRLTFQFDDSAESCVAKLRSGIIQFAILPREYISNEMESKVLKNEVYSLAIPSEWRSRSLDAIVEEEVLIDFNEADQMSFQYLRHLGLLSKIKKERHFVNNTDGLASMIEMKMGYSVLSEEFVQALGGNERIQFLKPKDTLDIKIALAWFPRSFMPDYLKAITKHIF